MAKAPRRQRERYGIIVEIPLPKGWHAYVVKLREGSYAFLDIRAKRRPGPEEFAAATALFTISVMRYAITAGGWTIVHKDPALADRVPQPKYFVEDALNPGRFEIYEKGTTRKAARREVRGLERLAAWEPEHVVDRLVDYFAGRPNKWVEMMRLGVWGNKKLVVRAATAAKMEVAVKRMRRGASTQRLQ